MNNVAEIQNAVQKLSREELSAFRDWFYEYCATTLDKKFEEDVLVGRLDTLEEEVLCDLRKGRCTEL